MGLPRTCPYACIGWHRRVNLIRNRTTDETRKWAVKLLEGRKIDDLDAGVDDQKGYKALLHGNPPHVMNVPSMAEETDFIVKHLKQLESEGVPINSVCLVCRTHSLLLQYEAALQSTGLATYMIKRSAAENRSTPGLRLATMHRVKGLEFDHIIIAGVNEGIVPLQMVLQGQDKLIGNRSLTVFVYQVWWVGSRKSYVSIVWQMVTRTITL